MIRKLGIGLIVAAFLWALGCLWWWAIFGMTEKIGIATYFTAVVLAFAGFTLVVPRGDDCD